MVNIYELNSESSGLEILGSNLTMFPFELPTQRYNNSGAIVLQKEDFLTWEWQITVKTGLANITQVITTILRGLHSSPILPTRKGNLGEGRNRSKNSCLG